LLSEAGAATLLPVASRRLLLFLIPALLLVLPSGAAVTPFHP
jgi:hypothetical protein